MRVYIKKAQSHRQMAPKSVAAKKINLLEMNFGYSGEKGA
jgi:hypothetical protein